VKRALCFVSMVGLTMIGCAVGPTPIPEAQSPAALLYAEKCGACHAVPHPKRNTAAEWQHLFVLMEQRMIERNIVALTDEQREMLMSYLQNNAR